MCSGIGMVVSPMPREMILASGFSYGHKTKQKKSGEKAPTEHRGWLSEG
jgi:hypothetical protein